MQFTYTGIFVGQVIDLCHFNHFKIVNWTMRLMKMAQRFQQLIVTPGKTNTGNFNLVLNSHLIHNHFKDVIIL